MSNTLYDTEYVVETPEGVELYSQLAGPVPRMLAYSIDLLIRGAIQVILFLVLLYFDRAGWGLFLLISFMLEWFYPVFFEVFRDGQTPGKRNMKLFVVNEDLTPITFSASMTRNLLRSVDFLPVGYIFGLISMILSKHFQRLGDIAAGTVVLHKKNMNNHASMPKAEPQPPPIHLEENDQLALINFAQRHNKLTDSRKEELANILCQMTKQNTMPPVSYLHSIANWLLGVK